MFSQFFVNISTTLKYFSTKVYMYSESVSNSSYVYDVIETSKEELAGLKMMLTFLSRATCPSSFAFFG